MMAQARPVRMMLFGALIAVAALVIPASAGGSGRGGVISAETPGGDVAGTAASCPWMDARQPAATRAHQLLAAMSLGDKIQMVTGQYAGPNAPSGASALTDNPPSITSLAGTHTGLSSIPDQLYNNFSQMPASYIQPIPVLCIPGLVLADSINGVGDLYQGATAFPDSIALTANWDSALTETYGQVLGGEAIKKGVNVLLGPGLDIARTPLAGRNFENLGEDPFLAGQVGAAAIRGVQSQHVIATAKHFLLNDQEVNKATFSADADQRTMQEIHMPPFAAAVKAGVGGVMCTYNRINSVWGCENKNALHDVLGTQLGFTGYVNSEWGATHSTEQTIKAGVDMEMPYGTYFGDALKTAVQNGRVSHAALDTMVYKIVYTMFRLGLFDHPPAQGLQPAAAIATTQTSLDTATRVGEAGTVLLKNKSGILPLGGSGKRIAVIGSAAGQHGAELCYQGHGAGHVPKIGGYVPNVVSPLTAINTRAARDGDAVTYADGTSAQAAAAVATAADVAIVVICDGETEESDRPDMNANFGDCFLLIVCVPAPPLDQNALVSAVAAANPNTVVVIQSGAPVAMPWVSQVKGVLENWFPGQTDGDTIAPILFGDVNPSGHLPVTFPVKLSDGPLKTQAQYPGVSKPGDKVGPHVSFSEGLLVGYRWYDAKAVKPLFPFGFGLSYTNFRFSNLDVRSSPHGALVTFTLTNTGKRAGADVAQVYVGDPATTGEPPRQLKGFSKVTLAPGESRHLKISLPAVSFAYWDAGLHTWKVDAGNYQIYVGDSSADLPLRTRVHRVAAKLEPGAY